MDNSFAKHMELRKTLASPAAFRGLQALDLKSIKEREQKRSMSWKRTAKDDVRDSSPRITMMRSDGSVVATPKAATGRGGEDADLATPERQGFLRRSSQLVTSVFNNKAGGGGSRGTSSPNTFTPPPPVSTSPASRRLSAERSGLNTSPRQPGSPAAEHERCWDDHTRCNVCEKKVRRIILFIGCTSTSTRVVRFSPEYIRR